MLYTGKGDNGKTTTFGCDQKISKSSAITEALGCLDEINSFLGIVKVNATELRLKQNSTEFCSSEHPVGQDVLGIKNYELSGLKQSVDCSPEQILSTKFVLGDQIVENIQQNLFIIQAEVAGSDMRISEDKVKEAEILISEIEKELPPIKTFFISGGTELAALFDFARTLVRRAERRVVEVVDGEQTLGEFTVSYLNRLSSLLYALARFSNHVAQITEESPNYK
jgi:ATP:cob(I)alamin adenosyltransferase